VHVSVSINFQEENRCRLSRITKPMSLRRPHEWNSSFLVKKGLKQAENGGTRRKRARWKTRSMDPYEASRGFHEDIERTKDRRRIRHVQSMHSKYLMVGFGREEGRESFENWVLYLEDRISPFLRAHLKQKYIRFERSAQVGKRTHWIDFSLEIHVSRDARC